MQEQHLEVALKDWRPMVKKYQQPNLKKAIIQLLNSFLPFFGLWTLMYFSLNWCYLITFFLAIVNSFFLVRIFIIQHDCGHQSFMQSRKLNNVIGYIASFFSTMPYTSWSRMHSAHHAHNGKLEFRGLGDIFFLTTEEFRNRSRFGKLRYRIFRSPWILFFLVPIVYLTITVRISAVKLKGWKKIRRSHIINNLLIGLAYIILASLLGWKKFLLIQLPILLMFGIISFWFFYIQHQHENNYNEPKAEWNHLLASILGSTYYKLPKLFQWLSGNIGFHHIHHLNSRIPNYHLESCAKENPLLNKFVNLITFKQSLKFINYKLWDETTQRMISFREYHEMRQTILKKRKKKF